MTETYHALGSEPQWIFAVIPVPGAIATMLMRRRRGLRPLLPWPWVLAVLYFFFLPLAGIPMEIMMCLASFLGAIGIVAYRRKLAASSRVPWWILAPLVVFPGVLFLLPAAQMGGSIVLTDSSITQDTFLGITRLPRAGIDAVMSHSSFGLAIRPTQIWTFTSKVRTKGNFHLPVSVIGQVYWGPHGLIHSGDLGRHIAAWAGVKPKELHFQGPSLWESLTHNYGRTTEKARLGNGTVAPAFTVLDSHGKNLAPSDFRGKIVVLDFWASWCGPCVASMPNTQAVVKRFQDSGVPVVCLAVDDDEDQAGFAEFVKEKQSSYPSLRFCWASPRGAVSDTAYRSSVIPTVYIIDSNGVIADSFNGYNRGDARLEQALTIEAQRIRR